MFTNMLYVCSRAIVASHFSLSAFVFTLLSCALMDGHLIKRRQMKLISHTQHGNQLLWSSFMHVSFVGTDWVDMSDPTVIAEAELLSAANSIEAAARKLSSLRPRLRPKVEDY